MTRDTTRRSILSGLAASIAAPIAGLFGGRARAAEPNIRVVGHAPVSLANLPSESAIHAERDRLIALSNHPETSPQSAREAFVAAATLNWVLYPLFNRAPTETVAVMADVKPPGKELVVHVKFDEEHANRWLAAQRKRIRDLEGGRA